ncbi:hypothetical protein Tco_0195502 [Tanacetum coccineum]
MLVGFWRDKAGTSSISTCLDACTPTSMSMRGGDDEPGADENAGKDEDADGDEEMWARRCRRGKQPGIESPSRLPRHVFPGDMSTGSDGERGADPTIILWRESCVAVNPPGAEDIDLLLETGQ